MVEKSHATHMVEKSHEARAHEHAAEGNAEMAIHHDLARIGDALVELVQEVHAIKTFCRDATYGDGIVVSIQDGSLPG